MYRMIPLLCKRKYRLIKKEIKRDKDFNFFSEHR